MSDLKVTVYADVLFAVNFVINMLLISVTAMITKSRVSFLRNALSASTGAIYALFMFMPHFTLIHSIAGKLILLSVMTCLAFGYGNIRRYIRHLCTFCTVTLMCGGCTLAYIYFSHSSTVSVNNGIVYFDTNLGTVTLSALVAGVAIKLISSIYRHHLMRDYHNLVVYKDGKSAILRVMIDTGNMLTDPLSGNPVIIVDRDALSEIVPKDADTGNIEALSSIIGGIRLIPFRSLGCESGILAGFRPDKVYSDRRVNEKITLAISENKLSPNGEYNAIAGPESFV